MELKRPQMKIKIIAIGFSILLAGSNGHAEPLEWLVEVTIQTAAEAVSAGVGSCIDALEGFVSDKASKLQPASNKPRAQLLVKITAESMQKIQAVSGEDLSEVIQVGHSIWLADGQFMHYRSKEDIRQLKPELEQVLFQAGILSSQ